MGKILLVAMEAVLGLMVKVLEAMEVGCLVAMEQEVMIMVPTVAVAMVVHLTLGLGVPMVVVLVRMGVVGQAMVVVAMAGTTHMQGRMLLGGV